jgi:exodeoxyribonuclease VII large subunit
MQLDLDFHRAPIPPEPKIHSVTELTRRIRELIERGVGEVWVEGEISNHRRQAAGHQYFTLKDDFCQLPCVLFSSAAAVLRGIKIADGQRVQVLGMVSVYEPRGQYQMVVRVIQDRGQGLLQAKFEALKRKLAAEGLFDAGRKRRLPRFPRRVGLVTSPTGAAIRDFLKVLHRRHPGIEVLINPVRVQGRGASAEIARAIRDFGQSTRIGLPGVDVIVVTRGGGSIEDLWEFNEEVVARAIAASPIPVLSAIGHEIDFTIADFVADLRAPTPSAAAEILAADRTEVLARLKQDLSRLTRACVSTLQLLTARLEASRQSALFREPSRKVFEFLQTLDRRGDALRRCAMLRLDRERNHLDRLNGRLIGQFPGRAIGEGQLRCRMLNQAITEVLARQLAARRARLERAAGVLQALNPHAILTRGYTITTDAEGRPLACAKEVEAGMLLRTRFHDGEVESIAGKR